MSDRTVLEGFFSALNAHDVDGAMTAVGDGATITVVPLDIDGSMAKDGREFLDALVGAFPDLKVRIDRMFVGSDGTAAVEGNLEGTQAAEFYGVINQEKHIDLDHAWRFALRDGKIADCRLFWCQNQLYRRLAVKRLDNITITASGGAS
jgi:ketosteroid isomerase-like protein